jgi:hypothetical protein
VKSTVPIDPVLHETEKEEELTEPVVMVQLFEIVMFVPLSVPIIEGSIDTIRILYKFPEVVPTGIEMLIVPLFAVEFNVPIIVGVVKSPSASDNWTVYMFPALKVPADVKPTVPVASVEQSRTNGEVETVPVDIVFVETQKDCPEFTVPIEVAAPSVCHEKLEYVVPVPINCNELPTVDPASETPIFVDV